MDIHGKEEKLENDLRAAYDALDILGATIVGDKNYHNLATAIGTIPMDESQYGKVYYYSTFTMPSYSSTGSTNITIYDIDIAGLNRFVEQRLGGQATNPLHAWYWMDSGTLKCSWEMQGGSWQQFTANELNYNYGINIGLINSGTNGELYLTVTPGSVDKTSAIVSAELLSSAEYNGLGNVSTSDGYNTCTVNGQTIPFADMQSL